MHRLFLSLLIVAGLACPTLGPALAQAPAPVGNWVPEDDPQSAAVMVMPNGDYLARDVRDLLEGRWAWRSVGANGGVLTITYQRQAVTQALRIEWLGQGRALVTDPASGQRRVWIRR